MRTRRLLLLLASAVLLSGCRSGVAPAEPRASLPASTQGSARLAKVVSREVVDERTDRLTIDSPAIGGVRSVWVMRPTAWKKGSSGWRALYMLHGCCAGGAWDWLKTGEVERMTADLDAVVIVPEGGPMGWYTDWHDGPAWETFHMTELPALIEPMYGVGGRRAVVGYSMGGFGAFGYAARHPGMFEAAASLSGVLDIRNDVEGFSAFLRSHGVDSEDVWGDPSGWAADNPADQVTRLKGVRLYVSSGNGDPGPLDARTGVARSDSEAGIMRQNETFAEAAEKAGLTITKDFYGDGTHTWPYWIRSFRHALPILLPRD
ncbi:alpha/beta hydrolase [Microtetraspora fusca]|uniref:Alpha/beta hydrolase n=1 Tax=Microtetraspora fusca TaxID=1997 RepID=A0ABW6VDD9_MICFU